MSLEFPTRFIRFCLVGCIATLLHVLVAYTMLHWFSLDLIIANIVAYITALWISYLANAIWSFNTKPTMTNLRKYLVSSLLILSVISSLSYLIEVNLWPNEAGILLVAVILPILNYLIQRGFVFNRG